MQEQAGHREHRFEQSARAPSTPAYTCPMDPEIVRNGPGTCPICGMALEPSAGSASPRSGQPTSHLLSARVFVRNAEAGTGFESVTGRGVRGDVDGRAVALGNLASMSQLEVQFGGLAEKAARHDTSPAKRWSEVSHVWV